MGSFHSLNPNGPELTNWPGTILRDESWLNIGATVRLERLNSAGVGFIASVQVQLRTTGCLSIVRELWRRFLQACVR